jgi:Penicillinase repressor
MRSRSPHTQEVTYTPPPLHELEREVMEEVWHRGEASVREIMMALNVAAPRERAYTTTTGGRRSRVGLGRFAGARRLSLRESTYYEWS